MSWNDKPTLEPGAYPDGAELEQIVDQVDKLSLFPVVQSADQTISSNATFQNSELVVALEPNARYLLRMWLGYNSGVTPGFKTTFTAPTGAACKLNGIGGPTNAPFNSTSLTSTLTWGGSASEVHGEMSGEVTTTDGGNLTLQFAQSTSNASNTTLRAGSYLELQRIDDD